MRCRIGKHQLGEATSIQPRGYSNPGIRRFCWAAAVGNTQIATHNADAGNQSFEAILVITQPPLGLSASPRALREPSRDFQT